MSFGAAQFVYLGAGEHGDGRVGEHLVADRPVEQGPADRDEELGLGEPPLPAVGGHVDHVGLDADAVGARGAQAFHGARQQGLDDPGAARPEQMGVAGLGYALAGFGAVGEFVAVDDGDPVEVPAQGPRREHSGESAADDGTVAGLRRHWGFPSVGTGPGLEM